MKKILRKNKKQNEKQQKRLNKDSKNTCKTYKLKRKRVCFN